MFHARPAVFCTFCLAAGLALPAVGQPEAAPPSATPGPRAEGRRLLAGLPAITRDSAREACFELTVEDQTIGYVVSSIKPASNGDPKKAPIHYDYTDESVLRGPDGNLSTLRTHGRLSRHFQPESITWETVQRAGGKETVVNSETLTVRDKDVAYRVTSDANAEPVRVARPSGPFVHLTGMLFSSLEIKPGQRFILTDFDTETKAFVRRLYVASRKVDGRTRLAMHDERGMHEQAYYILDDKGVAQHGAKDVPFTFRRCTPERVEEIRKGWNVAAPAGAEGDKPAGS